MNSSSSPPRCPRCGAPLPPDHAGALCPACMLEPPPQGRGEAAWTVGPGRHFEPPDPGVLAEYFPQLEIEELLGRGGMGAVYRARQKSLDRPIALKILPPQIAERTGFSERFTREAQTLARLNHPHIVTIFDFGQSGPYAYFLMEHIDGVNLRQVLVDGRLTPEESLAIVPQLCDALQFAHAHGVVHRDIKPENILLDSLGHVKIADFGLAKLANQDAASDATGTAHIVGTMYYMAPEQIEQPDKVDHRADIYSMGVVIYEMLTGELPLGRFQPPSQRIQVDVRLDEVVLRTLEKQPERRYSNAADVKTDVDQIGSEPAGAVHGSGCRSTNEAGEPWPERLEGYARRFLADHLSDSIVAAAIIVQLLTLIALANARYEDDVAMALILGGFTSFVLARGALALATEAPMSPTRSWLIGVPLAVIYLPILLILLFWPLGTGLALGLYFDLSFARYTDFAPAEFRNILAVIGFATSAALATWWMLLCVMIWQFPGAVRILLRPFADSLEGVRAKWFALLFLTLAIFAVVGLVTVSSS